MASNYDFRIIIETVSGSNISYGTSSLVSVQPNTSLVVNTDEMVNKINTMDNITVFNGKTHTTGSSLFNVSQSSRTFINTNIDGSSTDYQFVSASIKGNSDSGSILFHANSTPTVGGDFVKRYKFFGNKVCNVLGVPENYWIYADKFRLTNTGSEQNYISGDVLAQSLHLRDNFAISNAGAIESDLPMKHAKDTDRWIKWQDVSSSIPQNDMLIGYSNQSNEYMIRMQNNKNLILSSSVITASNDFIVKGNMGIGTENPAENLEVVGNISASGFVSSSGFNGTGGSKGTNFVSLDTDGGTFRAASNQLVNPFFNFISPAGKTGTLSIPGFNFLAEDTEENKASPNISIRAVLANSIPVPGYPTAQVGGKQPSLIINSGSLDEGNGFYFNFANDGVGRLGIGKLNPTTQLEVDGDISITNISSSGTFNLGSDTAEEHAIQGVSSLTQNGGGFIGNSNGMIRGHEVGDSTNGHPSNFKYFFCGYLDEGNSGTYEQMFVEVYGGRYSYNQAGITKYQITPRGSDGENDFEIYRQRYGSFTFDGEKFDIKILRNGTVNEKRYGVFIYNTTDQYPNFSVRAWKLTNNQTGQMQEIMVKEFESTLSGSSQPFDGYSDTESLVERYNTFEVNRDKVGINTSNLSQKLTVSGSIEIDDGDLRFDVGSGDTHGIDFEGKAAIRIDNDNNKLLIERTNGSGFPNQPIITIPTNTSDNTIATVEGLISASGGIGIDSTSVSSYAVNAGLKWQMFTGTLGNTNTTLQITHGITNGKKRIVSINVNVEVESGESTPVNVPDNSFLAGGGHFQDETVDNFEYQSWFDDSKIYLHVESSAVGIDNNRFTMIVNYADADLY